MNLKNLKLNKLIWLSPLIIGGVIGLVISKPRQSQSSQMADPVASEENSAQGKTSEVSSEEKPARLPEGDPRRLGNRDSKQSLDTYLVSAQSLLTKAITLSRETQISTDEDAEGKTQRHSEPATAGEESPENTNPEGIQERNKRIVKLINQAIDTTNQAIANYPSSAQAYAQQAKIYQTITAYMPKAYSTAIVYYQQAIKIDDNNPEYYTSLADLYLSSTDNEFVDPSVRPSDGQTHGSVPTSNPDRNLELAIHYLQKAVETDPTNPNQFKKLAEVQSQAGRIKQAKTTYQRLLGLLSDDNQKDKIKNEISSLNQLLAEAASGAKGNLQGSGGSLEVEELVNDGTDITLPDSPPKLQASDLASSNTYIAAPEEKNDSEQSSKLETNAKSGKAAIPAGEKQVEICNNHLGPDTQVYLAPEDNSQNVILFVKSKSPYDPNTDHCPNFTAGIAKTLEGDLPFRWWIIDGNEKTND